VNNFNIGDTIVHWTHGLGTVIGVEEMDLAGIKQEYYVIEIQVLKLWVPVEEANEGSIRFPSDSTQFRALFEILRLPGEVLPSQPYQRKIHLRDRMQKRTLEDLCHVIRDLTDLSKKHTLNQNDATVLFHAEEHLLDEWVISLGTNRTLALRELEVMLGADIKLLKVL
jgi:CarD family transcriptional regulator